jgi:protein-L-isoaspartate(D-aspartate) O-methyltransferase
MAAVYRLIALGVLCALSVAVGRSHPAVEANAVVEPPGSLLANGSFELLARAAHGPGTWYYLRQAKLEDGGDAPHGRRWLRFSNSAPGRSAEVQQVVGIDGNEIGEIDVSACVRLAEVRPGQTIDQRPQVRLSFYSDRYALLGEQRLGPWHGTHGWTAKRGRFVVPAASRKILITVGLMGATGTADFDALELNGMDVNSSVFPRFPGP